ncbi:hypothetical protein HLASF_0847 [Halanaeroarchaeum sulfurireducens]|uniref:Uncharacterized protein n=1 Tax=Halanaeroarchaeum sulfurireducens TaxID=1604004 RepID=A0A0F7PB15_9EURY|nr:hypothetical protein HLASF_0847 [Halanaeroarchaeum sulfurireducens]ALG81742.1 hypothetical protein HLASA_0844 [Halanaeroarchaeum sulfurireducens]
MIGNTMSSDRQPRLSALHHPSTQPPEPKYEAVCPTCGHTRRFYTDYEAIQHQKKRPCPYCNRMMGVRTRE